MVAGIAVEPSKKCKAKVLIIGDQGVGKTSLVDSFCSDGSNFNKVYTMTTVPELKSKALNVQSDNVNSTDTVEFLFIDSSGSELYETFNKKCWPQNCYLCFVFDVTNKQSLEKVGKWFDTVQTFAQKNAPGLLIGNKTDLVNRRFVTEATARQFAQKLKLQYFDCSSKNASGVQEAFAFLANEIRKNTK